MSAWLTIDELRRRGVGVTPSWNSVPSMSGWGFQGFQGLGAMGKGGPTPETRPGAIAEANQALESLYSQVRSLGDQIGQLQQEIVSLAVTVGDPQVKGLADDAVLLATNAGQQLGIAREIYEFDEKWVSTLSQGLHAGWAFGRPIVVQGAAGPNGQILWPWNKQMLLEGAVAALTPVKQSLAKDLGTIRGAREEALRLSENWRRAASIQQKTDVAVTTQQDFEAGILIQARAAEQERLARESQRQFELAQRQQQLDELRFQAETQRLQRQQELEQAKLAADAQRLQYELQAEQQRAQIEAQRLQQGVAAEQAQVQQAMAYEAQRQQAMLQAEMAARAPVAYSPTAAQGYAYGPASGAWPPQQYSPAQAAAAAMGIPGVVSYGQSQQPQVYQQQAPFQSQQFQAAPNMTDAFGSGIYGMRGMGAPTNFLTALPGLITSGGQAASNVIRARQGLPPLPEGGQAAPPPSSGLPGIGTVLLGAGALFVGYKLLSGGKKKKGRRR